MTNPSEPARSFGGRIVAAMCVLAVHIVTLLLVMVVLCSIVPTYAQLFENADIALPVVTQQLIRLSCFCVSYWYLIVLFGMLADTVIVAVLTLASSKRTWPLSAYSHVWLLAVIVFLFWASIVLCTPIDVSLIEPEPNSGMPQTNTTRLANEPNRSDISDEELREMIRVLPEFIDLLRHRESGDEAGAVLSMLTVLPPGKNAEAMSRNAARVQWAVAVHGTDRIKDAALFARDSGDADIRRTKTKELAELLRIDDVSNRTDAILERIAQGQTPTPREIAILTVAAELMRSDSATAQDQ